MSALSIVFMATPEFALPALRTVAASGHRISAVYTRPPRPAGRGQKERPTAVATAARELGLTVECPVSLKDDDTRERLAERRADAFVVVAYGLLLPPAVLAIPRLGCLNLHPSLLPRWRGAAPIARAIEAGDRETGATIMRLDEGLDSGPLLLAEKTPIEPRDTTGSLHDRLAEMGARLMVEALDGLAAGRLTARPQAAEGITYAAKIDKAEAAIDWHRPAPEIERLIRAFNPHPGAFTLLDGRRLKIHMASVGEGDPGAPPGTALNDRLEIACGNGSLVLGEVQPEGRPPMAAADFLRGHPVAAGQHLGP